MTHIHLHTDYVFIVDGSTFTVRYLDGDKVEIYMFGNLVAKYFRSDYTADVYPMRFVELFYEEQNS